MTTLATHPADEPDLLALIADQQTPLGKSFADAFRDACEADARAHGGWVNPNHVRLAMLDHPAYEPRKYSAQWSPACGRSGFLETTDRPVQISGKGSRGNGNKSTVYRRWVGVAA